VSVAGRNDQRDDRHRPGVRTGYALLIVSQYAEPLPAGITTPCNLLPYSRPVETVAYTTARALAVKGPLFLDISGEPFDCAQWSVSNMSGRLVWAAPSYQPPLGDVANIFRLDD
jgi:hypothetical protein